MEAYTAQADLFKSTLPYRPFATDDYDFGIHIVGRDAAARRRYVQPNPPALLTWMVFDIDLKERAPLDQIHVAERPAAAAFAWQDGNLPEPTWSAVNRKNGNAHLAYGLEVPVVRSDAGRLDPLRYAAAIEAGYRRALNADRSYAGLLCKNPLHKDWHVLWGREALYDLNELADWLPVLPKPEKRAEVSGLGRNVTLFDDLRKWAYRARRSFPGTAEQWAAHVLDRAEVFNAKFVGSPTGPLSFGEVKATAKSVAKWTWKHTTAAGFSAYQSNAATKRKTKQSDLTRQLILGAM